MTVRPIVMALMAALVAASLVAGCGGRQRPPERGSCRSGREWVPPHSENGVMMDGYCRDSE